jgi:hypothetical protein
MRACLGVLAMAVMLMFAPSLGAHHSAAQFDFGKTARVTGVVKKFQAINPHMRLVLEVTDAKGTREIEFEGHSTNNMYRAGYRNNMIWLGDKITVTIAPLRNGDDGGYVTAAVNSKGQAFGMGAQGAAERAKAEGSAPAAK